MIATKNERCEVSYLRIHEISEGAVLDLHPNAPATYTGATRFRVLLVLPEEGRLGLETLDGDSPGTQSTYWLGTDGKTVQGYCWQKEETRSVSRSVSTFAQEYGVVKRFDPFNGFGLIQLDRGVLVAVYQEQIQHPTCCCLLVGARVRVSYVAHGKYDFVVSSCRR